MLQADSEACRGTLVVSLRERRWAADPRSTNFDEICINERIKSRERSGTGYNSANNTSIVSQLD